MAKDSWVVFELPGFANATSGKQQDSIDALRKATETSYFKGPDAVWVKLVIPTAPKGAIHYNRTTKTSHRVAAAIARGEGVYVLHGVDYNGNGKYDFSRGKSELDPSLPAEATDPAACTVLHVQR